MVMVAAIGVLAATALPAYNEYKTRADLTNYWTQSAAARAALGEYYISKEEVPDTLEDAGIPASQSAGFEYDSSRMSLSVETKLGTFNMIPSEDEGKVLWHCYGDGGKIDKALPKLCKADEE